MTRCNNRQNNVNCNCNLFYVQWLSNRMHLTAICKECNHEKIFFNCILLSRQTQSIYNIKKLKWIFKNYLTDPFMLSKIRENIAKSI